MSNIKIVVEGVIAGAALLAWPAGVFWFLFRSQSLSGIVWFGAYGFILMVVCEGLKRREEAASSAPSEEKMR